MQHKEKIILPLCVVLSVCMCVCWQVAQTERFRVDWQNMCLGTRQPGFVCPYVCFVPEQGRRLQECLQLALRCIHTCPLQFGSYCEEPDISREIAAVFKLLLLEDLQDKMVCNSHPVLPLCFPCCWRCFHTALVWLYKDKRHDGICSCNNIQHFAPIHSWDSQKVCWQWRESFLPLNSVFLLLYFLYTHHVSYLFFHSAPVLSK